MPERITRRSMLAAAGAAVTSLVPAHTSGEEAMPDTPDAAPFAPLTIEQSLALAGKHLLGVLDPERRYLPYWQITVHPDYRAEMTRWWAAHNIGRWWDAMLRLEDATGFSIPARIEAAMYKNVQAFFDNPDAISLSPWPEPAHPFTYDETLLFDLHSLREGLLALNGLARWRGSEWAVEAGERLVRSANVLLHDNGAWDLPRIRAVRERKGVVHNLEPCDTHGRMLEALVWFHETTGSVGALRLADRIADFHLRSTTSPDGTIPVGARADHTHSYLGTLRGLLLYGRLTRQSVYVDRVAAAYRVNVPRVVKPSGYTSHNMVVESFGETTSPGDAAQLALWLWQAGHGEFIDDVERILRARLLPSQIRSTPPLTPVSDDGKDPHRNLERRILGAYGGCHSHPHGGKLAVTDVTAAGVHTLVDLYRHVAVVEGDTLIVLLHQRWDGQTARVRWRGGARGRLTVVPRRHGNVALRLPGWAPANSVRATVNGALVEPSVQAGLARLGRVPEGATVEMEYALTERTTSETGLGGTYEVWWRGDDVVGVRPNTDRYPFYADGPPRS